MTETKHTAEPWTLTDTDEPFCKDDLRRLSVKDANGIVIILGSYDPTQQGADERKACFARIVAAVNACAGIPTEALEAVSVSKLVETFGLVLDDLVKNDPECVYPYASYLLNNFKLPKAKGETDERI